MNAPARISQHDRQKAAYRLARANIDAAAKLHANTNKPAPVKPTGPIGKTLYEEPIEHCRMWKAWRVMMREKVPAAEYIKVSCYLAGVPHSLLMSRSRRKEIAKVRKAIVRDVAAIYINLSYPQLAKLFNISDHGSIIYHLFGKGGRDRGKPWNKRLACRKTFRSILTEDDVIEIRKTCDLDMDLDVIGRRFGVTDECIRMVLQRKTWKHVE